MRHILSLIAIALALAWPASAQIIVVKAGADGKVFEPTPLTLTGPIMSAPVISGTITGTYTLGGTPSIAVGGVTGLGTGVATFLATPSSANLATAATGETGSGALVFGTAPTLAGAIVTPAVTTVSADGAITIASGVVVLTKAGVSANTIAAPSSQNGTRITIISTTANAHIVTFTGGTLWDGTAGANTTATFAAVQGASMTVVAHGVLWYVESLNEVTPAP